MRLEFPKNKITLFFVPKRLTLMYSLYPILHSKYLYCFKFTSDVKFLLEKDTNEVLFIVGWQHNWATSPEKTEQLLRLRKKYRKIAFFEDNASSESELLDIIPVLDVLYKRTVYVDKSNYQKTFVDNRIFSDYYHHKYDIPSTQNKSPYPRLKDAEDLKKIKIAWNIGFGTYPLSDNKNRVHKFIYRFFGKAGLSLLPKNDYFKNGMPNPKENKCQARFGYKGYGNLVGHQRKLLLEKIEGNPNFLTGMVPLREYNEEIKNVRAILSPFGWGEVCFRDFEAILNGAVLVKPDMGHLETYPNIFQPNRTYVSVNWDGIDLVQKVEDVIHNQSYANEIRSNAWEVFQYSYKCINDRVLEIIIELQR